MSKLVPLHGGKLIKRLLEGEEFVEQKRRAEEFPKVYLTTRERDDLIMMGIGAFSPLEGFMGNADWKGVCDELKMVDGTFWPIPITLSVTKEVAKDLKEGQEVALIDDENDEPMGSMVVEERYTIDKVYECKQVFKMDDTEHPTRRLLL